MESPVTVLSSQCRVVQVGRAGQKYAHPLNSTVIAREISSAPDARLCVCLEVFPDASIDAAHLPDVQLRFAVRRHAFLVARRRHPTLQVSARGRNARNALIEQVRHHFHLDFRIVELRIRRRRRTATEPTHCRFCLLSSWSELHVHVAPLQGWQARALRSAPAHRGSRGLGTNAQLPSRYKSRYSTRT